MSDGLAIDVRDVTKTYGQGETASYALRGVDFPVRHGEFVMLSGPSGSGKTTLLSILGCILKPSTGTVRIFGKDITAMSEGALPQLRLAMIGFVFQAHNLLMSHTAEQNIALVLELRGWSKPRAYAEANRLLAQVGLPEKAKSKPGDLSGGQRQRVAIARALAGKPPLLLADEPTAALDAQNGLMITETLRDLAKREGHTVICVTHDNRIYHLADRIVRIEDGLIAPS